MLIYLWNGPFNSLFFSVSFIFDLLNLIIQKLYITLFYWLPGRSRHIAALPLFKHQVLMFETLTFPLLFGELVFHIILILFFNFLLLLSLSLRSISMHLHNRIATFIWISLIRFCNWKFILVCLFLLSYFSISELKGLSAFCTV